MTPDRPDVTALLATARAALKDEILPALPEERRLDMLMVLSVMGLAERALQDSTDALPLRQEARLAALAGEKADAAALARAIRGGDWDELARSEQLYRALVEDTRDRLARANPKYLAALEKGNQG
ncbi:DUF6285 domain-containing protein [Fodinicurvata sediminis]|uniref:DUF6285 domain-containing protein n=1 Tax=Fodinicurvata sediminis TaxID=1121832 RepID=UPI0003B7A44E|nr:DUF6285 domain-containing protein [Fodinicurvata sediminis]